MVISPRQTNGPQRASSPSKRPSSSPSCSGDEGQSMREGHSKSAYYKEVSDDDVLASDTARTKVFMRAPAGPGSFSCCCCNGQRRLRCVPLAKKLGRPRALTMIGPTVS